MFSYTRRLVQTPQVRMLTTTAKDLFNNSCYNSVEYSIDENSYVQEAVMKFSVFDIGCVAVLNKDKKLTGLFTEGDFIKKVAAVGKKMDDVIVKDVCTLSPNIMIASSEESLESCISKMNYKNVRHLAIVDNGQLNGLISFKDIFTEAVKRDKKLIAKLTDFNIGKGAFFGSE